MENIDPNILNIEHPALKVGVLLASNGLVWLTAAIHQAERSDGSLVLSTIVSCMTGFYCVLQIFTWFENRRKNNKK